MPRWIVYDLLSAQAVLLHTSPGVEPDEAMLVRAAEKHAKAYKHDGVPGDGDRFRLQRIPEYNQVPGQDFTYHAPRAAKIERT